MDTLSPLADVVESVLCELAAAYRTTGPIRTLLVFDRDRGQYLLVDEGWEGYRRIHTVWAHVEVDGSQCRIHEDGTEEGIANLLLRSGVSNRQIVLSFLEPAVRESSAFALA